MSALPRPIIDKGKTTIFEWVGLSCMVSTLVRQPTGAGLLKRGGLLYAYIENAWG